MSKILRAFVLCIVVLSVASCANLPKRNQDQSVLVIPSRYTVVQLGFDVARMRPVTLVAYDVSSPDDLMHFWNVSLQEWVKIDMDEYATGNLAAGAAVNILGERGKMPLELIDASAWSPNVNLVESLGIVEVLNSLHKTMRFSKTEWKSLAKRHGLTIEDRNADRRRYGKYGKPGEKRPVPMPQEEIIEEIGVEPMPPASSMVAPEDK